MGIDLVSLANNHTIDFDYDGLFSTLDNLDRVGMKYAGAGPVALVSCSAWLPEKNFQASLSHPHMKGRPGTNPINTELSLIVNLKTFALLKEARDNIIVDKGLNIPLEDIEK